MSCAYDDEILQKWDGVTNPVGEYCSTCDDCECEHWAGSCSECNAPGSREECLYRWFDGETMGPCPDNITD